MNQAGISCSAVWGEVPLFIDISGQTVYSQTTPDKFALVRSALAKLVYVRFAFFKFTFFRFVDTAVALLRSAPSKSALSRPASL